MNCENCGAPVSSGRECPYCGTRYKVSPPIGNPYEHFINIEVERPGVRTLRAVAAIDAYRYRDYPPEHLAHVAMHQIKEQMMDNLTEFIRFDKQDDPVNCKTLICGTIRVVDPSFRNY